MTLLLLLYAECPDAGQAARQAEALCQALQQVLPGSQPELTAIPERYWKISGYFSFDLRVSGVTAHGYRRLLEAFPGDWWRCDDESNLEAVWNAGAGPALLIEAARWAQLVLPLGRALDENAPAGA